MVGKTIDNYEVVAILGEGGMGIVYKAFDLKLERYVALKILSPQSLTNPNFIARFKREAKNQAKLTHPNIVPVYGFTEDGQIFGIVMEYVEGETLEHLIRRNGHLELTQALSIMKQILTGIGYAHSKGYVHRDIKPSNIIINTEGIVKIMDFGISKSVNESKVITRTGVKIGTILYMSPEQIRAQDPTNQSDIYSIGITFYEMLVGKTPFDFDSDYHIMEAHLKRNPVKLSSQFIDIPPETDNIIGKALHKSLDKRYKTCELFLDDIENLFNTLTNVTTQKKPKQKEKPKPKEKTVVITNEIAPVKKTLKSRIRFYSFTFLFICVFCLLFYYVYTTISQFWKSSDLAQGFSSEVNSGAAAGYHWRTIATPVPNCLNSICFVNDLTGYSCGNQGIIIKTTDGGYSWSTIGDSSGNEYYDVKFISPEKGFIVGEKGLIITTNDGGNTWQKISSDTVNSLFKIFFRKNNYSGFIVGAHGTILKTNDGGINWLPVNSPSGELLYSISFADNNNGVIVGWNGTILKTSDQGRTWIEEKKITDTYLRDVSFDDNNVGIAVGGSGEILRTDDGGNTWSKINSNSFSGFHNVYFSRYNTGFILGNKGEIFISKNSGKNWDGGNSGSFSSLTSITETQSKKIIISTNNGSIITN
jgi:eukaryotic-like serine/threonine-protein kinase